ncbi:flagellar motor switch protein FliN [Methylobacterium variabile]|jgi:flagellar motor switch protein FliN/FliY|uniref:Flagellar motor switch protein FliN n=1 Tax=Methylobacterium variabile TaxID=298794 RepID=A0A0J6T431_9HYPH|nr:flagellar motor switch protein FliN [Methylobacterium variabile]KMO40512.1 flagellar motor switch protein FliN [Methylobacterium variabile]
MTSDNDLGLPQLSETDLAFDTAAASVMRDAPVAAKSAADLEQVFDVPVMVSAVLGSSRMPIGDLLRLGPGTVLELDRKVGEAIDIFVNNRLVARGEVVLVEERLGVTMTEIVKAEG